MVLDILLELVDVVCNIWCGHSRIEALARARKSSTSTSTCTKMQISTRKLEASYSVQPY